MTSPEVPADRRSRLPQDPRVTGRQVEITNMGLSFPDQAISYDDWRRAGARVARIATATAWYLGDWLAYGESHYGSRYRAAIDAVGVSYQTLRNYAWVARRFPLSRRRDTLTFHHHMEVAKLPVQEQDHWLDLAGEQSWSVRKLRQQLRSGAPAGSSADEPAVSLAVPPLRIEAEPQRIDRWRAAAERASTPFGYWVVSCLDDAAGDQLAGESVDTDRAVSPDSGF